MHKSERGGARGKLMMLFKNAQSPHYPAAAVAKQAARVTFAVECETGCVRACVCGSVCVYFTSNWQAEFPSLTSSRGVRGSG